MSGEKLVGGNAAKKRQRRWRGSQTNEPPPQVGLRFLFLLVVIGAMFAAAGAWRVHTVFELRDHEMEAQRLQEVMRKRNDRAKTLVARVSHLQRAEIMKTAAEDRLGMAEPVPDQMQTVVISKDVLLRWQQAAAVTAVNTKDKEVSQK